MKYLLFAILIAPLNLFSQASGLFTYPEHQGKIINQIFKANNKEYALLSAFYADFDGFEESDVCEINKFHELVNCTRLSGSTLYWNVELAYDGASYIFAGAKCSDIDKVDTVIIEKRDLDFNLIQKYSYYSSTQAIVRPIVRFDSTYHLFIESFFTYDDNLVELIIPPGLDLAKTEYKIHDIDADYIDNFKALKSKNKYLAWYLWGVAEVDSSFKNPKHLNESVLIRQGAIVDALDGGYVGFGSALVKNNASELGIVKYNFDLNYVKIDTFGGGFETFEAPAVAYPISKNTTDYYVSGTYDLKPDYYVGNTENYFYVARYNKDIKRIWLKKLGGDRHYVVWGVEAQPKGGCCIYGMCRSKETKYKTIPFIMCIDENGSITSVEEKEIPYLDFTLLGNPGGNELKFNLGGQSESVSYQIADLNGRVISRGTGTSGMNIISAVEWQVGVYILTFYNGDKLLHSEKWIKAIK